MRIMSCPSIKPTLNLQCLCINPKRTSLYWYLGDYTSRFASWGQSSVVPVLGHCMIQYLVKAIFIFIV